MPKCKNDPTSFYIGNEPSPLGLGYSASMEKENTTKQGNDGNMWNVVILENGEKDWEEYQTYPYVSIIIWTPSIKKEFKNSIMEIESPEVFYQLKPIFEYLDENEVSYEIGWTKYEIDLELYDNFDFLDKNFYQNIRDIKKLTFKNMNLDVEKVETLLIKLIDDKEQLIEL